MIRPAKDIDEKTPWREMTLGGEIFESATARYVNTGAWRTNTPVLDEEKCRHCLLCVPFCLLYFLTGETFIRFFLDAPTDDALHTGVVFLRILSPFYFVVSAKLAADGVLRGAGLMKKFMIATFTDLILRVVLALVLARTALGSTGIWCAWPIGWIIGTGLSLLFYRQSFHQKAPV